MNARDMIFVLLALCGTVVSAAEPDFQAGVARTNITPKTWMWMSGYRARDKAASSKLTELWAKALALQDRTGRRCVLVTADLVGVDRRFSLAVRQQYLRKYGLDRAAIAICTSHTHSGPVVGDVLAPQRHLNAAQQKLVDDYAAELEQQLVELVGRALSDLRSAELRWGAGTTDFAVNRRENREADVPKLQLAGQLKGPVDHDVPVLQVLDGQGRTMAVVFGYACHATVTNFFEWSGDYPGFAQAELEQSLPGTVAMFWAGCGADQNPMPRRKVSLARQYGRQLAETVQHVLQQPMQPIAGTLASSYREIALPLETLPSVAELEEAAKSRDTLTANWGRVMLERRQRDGGLFPFYPYPVQVWQLGDGPTWIVLGGEVVVDYALRFKADFGRRQTWVAGYSNDVMNYIPSRRVHREGGYEGARAMFVYGRAARWQSDVEERIARQVQRQVSQVRCQAGQN